MKNSLKLYFILTLVLSTSAFAQTDLSELAYGPSKGRIPVLYTSSIISNPYICN